MLNIAILAKFFVTIQTHRDTGHDAVYAQINEQEDESKNQKE